MNDHPHPLLLKSREAAELLSISERKLWQLTKDKKITAVRLGHCVRYRVADLVRDLDELSTVSDEEASTVSDAEAS